MVNGTRKAKPAISYVDLHKLCNVHSEKARKARKRSRGNYFQAERVIERRNRRGTKEYLVKWIGYPTWQSTWEPEENLNQILLRSYQHPKPSMDQIDECCLAFHAAVIRGLKYNSVHAQIYVPFRLDVWRFLIDCERRAAGRGGAYILEKEDFNKFFSLPHHWYYVLNQHGEGTAVDFPMKVRPLLSKSCSKDFVTDNDGKLCKAPVLYIEKLSLYFVKRACNINNI